MGAPKKRSIEMAEERDRIRRLCDPVGFLASVMSGKPVAVLDYEGEPVKYERPTMEHRIVAGRELLKKLLPDLKAVDLKAEGASGMVLNFHSPIPLPNSRPVHQIEVEAEDIANAARQIEAHVIDEEDDE